MHILILCSYSLLFAHGTRIGKEDNVILLSLVIGSIPAAFLATTGKASYMPKGKKEKGNKAGLELTPTTAKKHGHL
jgi:hypothetical protein